MIPAIRWTSSALGALFDDEHDVYRAEVQAVADLWTGAMAASWDEAGTVPTKVFEELAAAGVFRRRHAAGLESGIPHGFVLLDELARRSSGLGLAVMTHVEVFLGALRSATAHPWHDEMIEGAEAGSVIGCFAATEDDAGSDLSAISTTASTTATGWRIEGAKRYVSNSAVATHGVILARHGDADLAGRFSLFLVDLRLDGVQRPGLYPKAGLHATSLGRIELDVEVPSAALLGLPGSGPVHASRALELERLALAFQLLAAARSAVLFTAAYARQRPVLGRPLLEHPVVRQRLGDDLSGLWAAEALLVETVGAMSAPGRTRQRTAAVKLVAATVSNRVVDSCLQILGGRGYTAIFPLQQLWRDVRVGRIGGGTDEIMRDLVAASVDPANAEWDAYVAATVANDLPVRGDSPPSEESTER